MPSYKDKFPREIKFGASYSWLPAVNDNEGREAVISVYDRAIALAEQEEVAK